MRGRTATIYAAICTLLLAAGFLVAFFFAQQAGISAMVWCIVGLAAGFVVAPIVHEVGHICFAKAVKMRVVYAKFFCFKLYEKQGKLRLGFASPFAADQTQALPLCGGNMRKRAKAYTVGGLAFGAVLTVAVAGVATVLSGLGYQAFFVWGLLPYSAYLLFLNALPCEYASGKTDMLVYLGLKKGCASEENMLAAMEIQGLLSEGNCFAEIEEKLYFSAPQLAEDEPLFAVMLDLRYRYYLEKNEVAKAGECLARLASVQDYLSDTELEKLAAELVYLHSVCGDKENAEKNGAVCQEYLRGESVTAKRALAAYSLAFGGESGAENAKLLLQQAKTLLDNEKIKGVARFEGILLSRLQERL